MRVAIVSDVHGNRRAFVAVLADLRQVAPDLVVHGGDLAYGGARPAEIVDQVRALGWPGVVGNTDEMLWAPKSLAEFAAATRKDFLIGTREPGLAWSMPAPGTFGGLPCRRPAMTNCTVRMRRLVRKSWSTDISIVRTYAGFRE